MILSPERLAELEFEACQQEKRDRINARLQVWSVLIGLVGAFVLAALQGGNVPYVVGVYPMLAAYVGRFASHSEAVLDQIKAYLFLMEERSEYEGYEHFNHTSKV